MSDMERVVEIQRAEKIAQGWIQKTIELKVEEIAWLLELTKRLAETAKPRGGRKSANVRSAGDGGSGKRKRRVGGEGVLGSRSSPKVRKSRKKALGSGPGEAGGVSGKG